MAPLMTAESAVPSVGSQDELTKAIAMAHARAEEVYAKGHHTLVDQISAESWKTWSALAENANASDPDGLEGSADDDDCDDLVAA